MTIDTVRYDALVVGTGFSGIAASVMLQSRGMNFVILEKAPASGGTWYHNHYPCLTVDIPAPLYSLSFALAGLRRGLGAERLRDQSQLDGPAGFLRPAR